MTFTPWISLLATPRGGGGAVVYSIAGGMITWYNGRKKTRTEFLLSYVYGLLDAKWGTQLGGHPQFAGASMVRRHSALLGLEKSGEVKCGDD